MKDLKRILELIRKTGDRYLFEDENGELFVILPAHDYEKLVFKQSEVKDLSKDELLNKINRDIALWKASLEDRKVLETWQNFGDNKEEIIEDDKYYFEPVDDEEE